MEIDKNKQVFEIPLFPLHTVLFPHMPLQLHVFETRYKVMIERCLQQGSPFGVVLIREGDEVGAPAGPFDVGCTAQILGAERFEDGRMNLVVAGRYRFRLLEYTEADLPYLVGKAELLEDRPYDSRRIAPLTGKLAALFVRYLEMLATRSGEVLPPVQLPGDPVTLSFCAASVLLQDAAEKQILLELTDTAQRIEHEILWLKGQMTLLEDIEKLNVEQGSKEKKELLKPINPTDTDWQDFLKDSLN
jgi:Lon protease-like protein